MITVIFTCFNRREKTLQCMKSLSGGNKDLAFRYVIVDDNSTDGTYEALEDLKRSGMTIDVLRGTGNLFWAGGMRKGIAYAKENTEVFLHSLPHRYYEENNLHMMLITGIKDYDRCITEVENFLPYIDNWATCDFPAPACFKNNTDRLLTHIVKWIDSDEPYTIRYGIGMLMRLYLDDNFKDEYLNIVAQVKSEEYYVNMMIAWYMATALAKQWDSTIVYIEEKRLPEWVHKKTIRKAIESYRITDTQKEYLRTLI